MSNKIYGVIGAGSFGTVISNLIAENAPVLLYTRREHIAKSINKERLHPSSNTKMHDNVQAIMDLEQLCNQASVIFPVVRSADFRKLMQQAAPYLRPDHILIHGIKGLNLKLPETPVNYEPGQGLRRSYIKTMSDIIREESVVIRIGCISGPNLARELTLGQPAATVVASRFEEVVEQGKMALRNDKFRVYSSSDLLGVEVAGVLKNIIAIASGMLSGLELGENTRALLLTRGLGE
ncbi:MAG: NAD(P)H-dependent glycerol-3-phosphate dehydrogenase, partial [Chitinophagales bacterium]